VILYLTEWLARDVRAFNVFQYITLRAVLGTMTALLISFVIGPRMIAWLTRMKIGQAVRDDGPQTHLAKAGTPTMGGALILVSIAITTLLWADLDNRFVWVVLLVMAGFGAVGWVDDWRKVVHRNPKGLAARVKFGWQSVIGLIAAVYLAFSVSAPDNARFLQMFVAWMQGGFNLDLPNKADLIVPFFKTVTYPLGVWGFITLSYGQRRPLQAEKFRAVLPDQRRQHQQRRAGAQPQQLPDGIGRDHVFSERIAEREHEDRQQHQPDAGEPCRAFVGRSGNFGKQGHELLFFVMAGLRPGFDPVIHAFEEAPFKDVDARDKPGHDELTHLQLSSRRDTGTRNTR